MKKIKEKALKRQNTKKKLIFNRNMLLSLIFLTPNNPGCGGGGGVTIHPPFSPWMVGHRLKPYIINLC